VWGNLRSTCGGGVDGGEVVNALLEGFASSSAGVVVAMVAKATLAS
jgi:hypothetical protein